jgi:hypothetical protein
VTAFGDDWTWDAKRLSKFKYSEKGRRFLRAPSAISAGLDERSVAAIAGFQRNRSGPHSIQRC